MPNVSNSFRVCLVAAVLMATACQSSMNNQPMRPVERYNEMTFTPILSNINVPLSIAVKDIEKFVNNTLKGVLYETVLNDGIGSTKLLLFKSSPIAVQMEGQKIKYKVPLLINLEKNVAISTLKADGEMALNFVTNFDIQSDWSVLTTTVLEKHNWTKSPVLTVGGVKVPIQYIADKVIEYSKGKLAKTIDQTVKEKLLIKPAIQEAWQTAQVPMQLSPEYGVWMQIQPQTVSMTPLQTTNGIIKSIITFNGYSNLNMGDAPETTRVPLPSFSYNRGEIKDDFVGNINIKIPFKKAEALANQMMVGQTFSQGKSKVTVKDIRLFGQGDYLIVNTALTGSYNGSIYLSSKPIYNANTNEVELENLDFELNTKNFLLKSAKWLFNKALLRMIENNLKFQIADNLQQTKTALQQQIANYQVTPNVLLQGSLKEFRINGISLQPDAMNIRFLTNGKLNLDVKGL